jgi:hypothetical protein
MAATAQNNQKGNSTSPVVQHSIDQSWGKQQDTSTSAAQALGKKFTNNQAPIPKK